MPNLDGKLTSYNIYIYMLTSRGLIQNNCQEQNNELWRSLTLPNLWQDLKFNIR